MNVYVEKLNPLNTGTPPDNQTEEKACVYGNLPDEMCDVYVIRRDKATGEYSGKIACDPLATVEW